MSHGILLVDAQRETLRQLKSALRELPYAELQIVEAASGEEALLASAKSRIDVLVAENQLPGMSGVDLMRKLRAGHPDISVILLTSRSESESRRQMLNAGALEVFEKPVPHADFLAAVQRALGLEEATSSGPSSAGQEGRHARISDLLANFRQDHAAAAVLLVDEHASVLARAGDLPDRSNEAVLLSALTALHAAGIMISSAIHQPRLEVLVLLSGGGLDLLFAPITPMHALLVAGDGLAGPDRVKGSSESIAALSAEVLKSLAQIGVTGELRTRTVQRNADGTPQSESAADPGLDSLLTRELPAQDSRNVDAFWEDAATARGARPPDAGVLTYEQAKKMGLLPDQDEH